MAISADGSWEQRQKHASFFQTQIASSQQAAIAAQTSATLILTLVFAVKNLSGFGPGQDWYVVYAGVFAWLFLGVAFTKRFSRSACRIREAYLAEHVALFPSATPYRLESYLLDFADKAPLPVRGLVWRKAS